MCFSAGPVLFEFVNYGFIGQCTEENGHFVLTTAGFINICNMSTTDASPCMLAYIAGIYRPLSRLYFMPVLPTLVSIILVKNKYLECHNRSIMGKTDPENAYISRPRPSEACIITCSPECRRARNPSFYKKKQ